MRAGPEVVWNLFGVRPQPGKYYDAVVTVDTGPACGSRKASAVWRACVVCPPYFVPPPPPPPPPPNSCPAVSFSTRAAATAGQDVPITATLSGAAPEVTPRFKWTVLAGGHINGRAGLEGTMLGPSVFSGRVAGGWAASVAGCGRGFVGMPNRD